MGFFMWEDMQICESVGAHIFRQNFHIYIRTLGWISTQEFEIARNFHLYILEKLLLWWCLTWSKSRGKSSQDSWGSCMDSLVEIWKNQLLQCFRQSIDCVFPIPKTGVLARKDAHSFCHFYIPLHKTCKQTKAGVWFWFSTLFKKSKETKSLKS